MRIIRSWPDPAPAAHARVEDDAPRLLNRDYDYSGLVQYDDDVLHLDWDMAVHLADLEEFARRAKQHPDRVIAAPYLSYPTSLHEGVRAGTPGPLWTALIFNDEARSSARYVTGPEDLACHVSGFGMIYLPREMIAAHAKWCAGRGIVFSDTSFGNWHQQTVAAWIPLTWDIRPVHLNYAVPETL
jgi:hypothetical protein